MKKENKNFLYNVLYQIFVFVIPLITMPYVSRILGVDNIGIYSYTHSIVNYFMLATLLGINNYGTREISKASQGGDRRKLSKVFCEIYYLQLITGSIMLFLYLGGIWFFANEYKHIFFIQSIYIVSAIVDINWFFFGLEKFKTTISRNIIIKILSLVLIFIFVKTEGDLVKYVLILSISTLMSQLYLWIFLRKYISLVKRKFSDIARHLKQCLILFIPVIAYSIYRIMDKTMLGFISGTIPVGYYESAEKIINIPIVIIVALGTVMLPNMSKDLKEKAFKNKLFSSFNLVLLLIIPMFTTILFIAKDFAVLFFGEAFAESGSIIQFLAVTMIFSAITNVLRTHYLIPRRKDKIYVRSTMLGAVVNLILNCIFIPFFNVYGACIGTIAAEFVVMLYQLIFVSKEINLLRLFVLFGRNIIKTLPMIMILVIISLTVEAPILRLVLQCTFALIIFLITNFKFLKTDFFGKETSDGENEKKKVLMLLASNKFSGAENIAVTIIEELSDKYDFLYVSRNGPIENKLSVRNINYKLVNNLNVKAINKIVKEFNPDIIHAHDYTASTLAALSDFNGKIVSHIHCDATFARKWNARTSVFAIVCKRFDKIVYVSSAIPERVVYRGAIKDKKHILLNVVDKDRVAKLSREKTSEAYDILYIGRLSDEKNPLEFIDIVKKVSEKKPDVRAAMLGDGVLMEECKDRIEKFHLDKNIVLNGFVDNPYPIMRKSLCVVAPSKYEGLSVSTVEALLLGTPVFTYKEISGMIDIYGDNKDFLCDNKNDVVGKLLKFLDRPYRPSFSLENTTDMQLYLDKIRAIYEQ